jgi:hypothetical protein
MNERSYGMGKRILGALLIATFALAACKSNGTSPGASPTNQATTAGPSACPPAATPLAALPTFPPDFPVPDELTLTSVKTAGPSTIVEGSWDSDLPAVYTEFKDAFEPAGYDVTFSEQEESDAEVNFAGGNTTGQVKLTVECPGRTHVKITIRPA